MKKIIVSSLMSSIFTTTLLSQDFSFAEFTGDKKLACEAVLCLSTSNRPSECEPSIEKYFSILRKKAEDTLEARKDFLALCPVGDSAEADKEFQNLRDNIIPYITENCSIENLNRIEYGEYYKRDRRINPELTRSCELLMSSSYTYLNPKYTCSGEWYILEEWNRGTVLERISEKEFRQLPRKETKVKMFGDNETAYYKYVPIKKDCWVFEN
ncbi:hypothetical protein CP965_05420 [Halarcobacter mediterraneus]|uniref:Conjugal transfer protein TrbM n=1 Tax=Halarcobacter mediterraneus TaxID=2023153 RepID=A0A4Q1AY02_9BACT|nr:TrbM/KikA/MpfK family conjugal transfer protein [Halarcobacter mediterraneus]RXK13240.1 hypothetical protein CP965_05420 [Halarcobacter mediterraneus]